MTAGGEQVNSISPAKYHDFSETGWLKANCIQRSKS